MSDATALAYALACFWAGMLHARAPRPMPPYVPLPPAPAEAEPADDLWSLDRPATRETTIGRGIATARQFAAVEQAGVMIVVQEPDGCQHYYGSSNTVHCLSAAATLLESAARDCRTTDRHRTAAVAALAPLEAYR
jgi:hypothetical protein